MPTDPAPWLPLDDVLAYLGVDASSSNAADVDRARVAAAAYVEAQRPELVDELGAYTPSAAVRYGAMLLAARLYARRQSPAGLASFGEFGPAAVLRLDPDIERMLGVGRFGKPRLG